MRLDLAFSSDSDVARPSTYGAKGDGVMDDSAAFSALAAALVDGNVIDLGGLTYYITTPFTVTKKRITLRNGKLLGSTNRTLVVMAGADDFTAERCTFQRATGSGGETTSDQISCVTVAAKRFRSLYCDYYNANLACLYFANGSCEGSVVRGGYFENSNSRQNSCFVYVASGATTNERITVDGIYGQGTGCSDGLVFFDAAHCRVEGNVVRDLSAPADVIVTGWAVVSGSVYRVLDPRTDSSTLLMFKDGSILSQNTSTPTNPASGEWGLSGGYIYVNVGDSPASHTMLSRITGGYGITFYSTQVGGKMHENLVAHNEVRTVDGFGCYWQLDPADARNKGIGNRYYDVCKKGLQNISLPFAGVSVSGGVDTQLIGEHVEVSGYHCFFIANSATGTAVNCYAGASTSKNGFRVRTSNFGFLGCTAKSNGSQGFALVANAGDTLTGCYFNGCRGISNTSDGIVFENGAGTDIKGSIIGGEYHSNGLRGIAVNKCSDVKVVGVTAHDNNASVPQIRVSNAASARILVDGCIVYGSTGTGIEVDGTDIQLGVNYCNTTTPYNIVATLGTNLGFYGATPVVQPVLATGASHTVDDVITTLQTLGLVGQS